MVKWFSTVYVLNLNIIMFDIKLFAKQSKPLYSLIQIISYDISTHEYGGLNLRLLNLSHACLILMNPPLKYQLKEWPSHYLIRKEM